MKVSRPLAYKLQEGITVILSLIELGETDRAKVALREMSQLIADQTVKTVETPRESEDLHK